MRVKLSENIKKFRKERKMTQEQLAEAMGVSVRSINGSPISPHPRSS